MPAVINVGGPVAWGLVVLVSAWAVRAGRALAGRRRARSKDDDDELELDPSAPQPRFLQQLSATAIRMLIETGALPCAIIELSDGGGHGGVGEHGGRAGTGGQRPLSGPNKGAASGPRSARNPGAAAGGDGPVSHGPSRIVPPELAAAVPCMPGAAWVRALQSPEHWRAELTRAATAAAAAVTPPGGGSGGSASLRSSYSTPMYSTSPYGRTAEGLLAQPRQTHSLNSGGGGRAGSGSGAVANGIGQRGFSLSNPCPASSSSGTPGAQAQPPDGQDAGSDARSMGAGRGSADLGSRLSPLLEAGSVPAASFAGAAISGRSVGSFGGAAAIAAAAAANMAAMPYPPRHALLVVLGRSERAVAAVTAAAAREGYSRAATWVGTPESFASTSLAGPRLPSLSRHGLWLMLQLGPDPLFHVPSLVLDVRRPDERLSYGAIRGTVNVPAEELACALALPPAEFRRRYGCARPGPDDVVVTASRSARRAAWAAQLCLDAGLRRVFVYGEGVYGWRLEDRVKPYRAYDLGALPPDPEPFAVEEPDEAAGLQELHALGMPLRQGPRPSRFALAAPAPTPAPAPVPAPSTASALAAAPPLQAALASTGGGGLGPHLPPAAAAGHANAAAGVGGLWQRGL